MFLPTTREEICAKSWHHLDIILITGDTYIDSPNIGIAIIGNILSQSGYKVGIIAQPDDEEITRLGEPRLFWGVSAGSFDSMVANYTATKKRRNQDDLTPGGYNNRRPDRASIYYTNLIRRYFKATRPIVLGGIEASIRRIAHYDYWDDKVRRSILFDSKADIIVYGMAEKTIIQLADFINQGRDIREIRGICYISKEPVDNYQLLPSYEEVREDKKSFIEMFKLFYENNDPLTAKGLCQRHGDRYLIQNPPSFYPSQQELDNIYQLSYEREVHPFYKRKGNVKAMETIRYSITSHRGCYGECNFCSISIHQGRTVISRSIKSILKEAENLTQIKGFRGIISDVGGPTANMYGIECKKKLLSGACKDRNCLSPTICERLDVNHSRQMTLLNEMRLIKGIKKIFIASGIRHDMILEDKKMGINYLKEIVQNHISGQLKIAPEHSEDYILKLMRKPSISYLIEFKKIFDMLNKECNKKQFLTYYFIAAHPGCQISHMNKLKGLLVKELKLMPEQVQIFTPLPSTYSSLMYYTEIDPFSGRKIFVEKNTKNKERQKAVIIKS
ncbi:MAG: YgiQ family radical SAM protein [Thermodesulfovibrionales bacterium]|nr:YgiQ family radical SAM protein [Thermodesulfovibrionales bacterium]